jgi:hypothetical protein
MTIRTFCTLAAAIWASWIAVIVAGALSFVGFRAAMRS